MKEFEQGIFEIPPGQTRYGKREFVGYRRDRLLLPNNLSLPFYVIEATGKTPKEAFKALDSILETYIKGAVGHIHWRFGPLVKHLRDGEYRAMASLLVNPHTPSPGPRKF